MFSVERAEKYRMRYGTMRTVKGDPFGVFILPANVKRKHEIRILATDGNGDTLLPVWEHVSVSLAHRTPTWDEMCLVKSLFWQAHDCVVQYHPAESEYVNNHPHCLHLWRNPTAPFPIPPTILVGLVNALPEGDEPCQAQP